MKPPITVVISLGQSSHPAKRTREDELAARLASQLPLNVMVVPPLSDLRSDGPAWTALRQTQGDLIVFAWLYPRATRWLLDRYGVVGRPGTSRLHGDLEDPDPGAVPAGTGSNAERVIDGRDLPTRHIYCLDLRAGDDCQRLIDEVRRIADPAKYDPARTAAPAQRVQFIDDPAPRRWFPVIDYSRCTNCMECIDFCLFGVYGIDARETILVEQPDNCRQGCPACSRVCPENAIMFPRHKAPAIAGAVGDTGGFKIDLSQLFGAPSDVANARLTAVREREQQLAPTANPNRPDDELEQLIEELDELDL